MPEYVRTYVGRGGRAPTQRTAQTSQPPSQLFVLIIMQIARHAARLALSFIHRRLNQSGRVVEGGKLLPGGATFLPFGTISRLCRHLAGGESIPQDTFFKSSKSRSRVIEAGKVSHDNFANICTTSRSRRSSRVGGERKNHFPTETHRLFVGWPCALPCLVASRSRESNCCRLETKGQGSRAARRRTVARDWIGLEAKTAGNRSGLGQATCRARRSRASSRSLDMARPLGPCLENALKF